MQWACNISKISYPRQIITVDKEVGLKKAVVTPHVNKTLDSSRILDQIPMTSHRKVKLQLLNFKNWHTSMRLYLYL